MDCIPSESAFQFVEKFHLLILSKVLIRINPSY